MSWVGGHGGSHRVTRHVAQLGATISREFTHEMLKEPASMLTLVSICHIRITGGLHEISVNFSADLFSR